MANVFEFIGDAGLLLIFFCVIGALFKPSGRMRTAAQVAARRNVRHGYMMFFGIWLAVGFTLDFANSFLHFAG